MNTKRVPVTALVGLLLVGCGGVAQANVSMNFDTLTTSPYINFSNLYSGSPPSESANLSAYQTDTPGAWYGGNYVPDQFQITPFNGGSVLQMGIAPSQYQSPGTGGFSSLNFQGMRYDTNLSGTTQTMSIQLYVDPNWGSTTTVDVGMAAVGVNNANSVVSNPAIAYLNADSSDPIPGYSSAGFYSYDYSSAKWNFLAAANSGFNTVSFTLTSGSGIQYYLNGAAVGSLYADTVTTSLQSVMLYALNPAGSLESPDSLYEFDNFSANNTPVPEGSTLLLLLPATFLLLRRGRLTEKVLSR